MTLPIPKDTEELRVHVDGGRGNSRNRPIGNQEKILERGK